MIILYYVMLVVGGVRMSDMKEMVEVGFVDEKEFKGMSDVDKDKKYKCYLSKKCNDEKFERIKKMFEYVKEDKKFVEFIGKDEYKKLEESYGKKEKRGEIVKVDYDGMDVLDVFMKDKKGVSEIVKKGYSVDMNEGKGMGIYRKVVK